MTKLAPALASIAFVAVGALGACKGPEVPPCPAGDICAKPEVVRLIRQTPEEQLGCPTYIGWGIDGGVSDNPLAGLPPAAEGMIDRESTRKRREGTASEVCCYHWTVPCTTGVKKE